MLLPFMHNHKLLQVYSIFIWWCSTSVRRSSQRVNHGEDISCEITLPTWAIQYCVNNVYLLIKISTVIKMASFLRLSRIGPERSFVWAFFNFIPLCMSVSSAPRSFCSCLFSFGLSVLAMANVGGGGAGGGGGGILYVYITWTTMWNMFSTHGTHTIYRYYCGTITVVSDTSTA